jgi:hypothetical protein
VRGVHEVVPGLVFEAREVGVGAVRSVVERDEEDLVGLVEDVLRAVAVVEVQIQDRHPLGCT